MLGELLGDLLVLGEILMLGTLLGDLLVLGELLMLGTLLGASTSAFLQIASSLHSTIHAASALQASIQILQSSQAGILLVMSSTVHLLQVPKLELSITHSILFVSITHLQEPSTATVSSLWLQTLVLIGGGEMRREKPAKSANSHFSAFGFVLQFLLLALLVG